jgi:hypothetical protein
MIISTAAQRIFHPTPIISPAMACAYTETTADTKGHGKMKKLKKVPKLQHSAPIRNIIQHAVQQAHAYKQPQEEHPYILVSFKKAHTLFSKLRPFGRWVDAVYVK